MFKRILLMTVLALIAAGPSPVDTQYSQEKNLVFNPGFENNIAGWTSSGGTFAATTTAAQVGSGRAAASFDASATSQYVESAAYVIPQRMIGTACSASIWYKGGDANLTLQVVDGAAAVLDSAVLSAETSYKRSPELFFPCGAADTATLKIKILSTADAAVIYIDDAFFGHGSLGSQTTITKWQSYTPIVANAGSKTMTATARYRQVGDSMEIVFMLDGNATASGSAATTAVTFTIPSGFTIDATKDIGGVTYGSVATYGISTASQYLTMNAYGSTSTTVRFSMPVTDLRTTDLNVARDMDVQGRITVPITEWANSGTSLTMSDNVIYANTRTSVTTATAGAYNTGDIINYNVDVSNPGALYSAGTYTAPADGSYFVSAKIHPSVAWSTNSSQLAIFKNGVSYSTSSYEMTGRVQLQTVAIVPLLKGDTVSIRIVENQAGTVSLTTSSDYNRLDISRIADFSAGRPVSITSASATSAGLVSTTTQTIAGAKTFNDGILVASGTQSTLSYYRTGSATFAGDFTSGTIYWTRVGNLVTVSTTVMGHASNAGPTQGAVIPSWAVPPSNVSNIYTDGGSGFIGRILVATTGDITISYYSDMSTNVSRTSSSMGASVSYIVTP